jgi:hypothetical protein
MLDYRAWVLAGAILLLAAGAYIFYVVRPRAEYQARSLSAAHHSPKPSEPVTKNLHVDGCYEDFIVKPGQVVEPRAVPGASPDAFRAIYGKETKPDKNARSGALHWDENAFILTDGYFGAQSPANYVQIEMYQGHVAETFDGVELGVDSFGTIFHKLRDRQVEVHQRIDRGPNGWVFIVSFYSSCGRKFRSEYRRTIPFDPETDREILPRPSAPGAPAGTPPSTLLRSDIFMNKVSYDFVIQPSGGSNDSTEGQPAEHD